MSTTHYSAPGPPQPGAYEFVRIDRAASSNGTMHARAVQHGTGWRSPKPLYSPPGRLPLYHTTSANATSNDDTGRSMTTTLSERDPPTGGGSSSARRFLPPTTPSQHALRKRTVLLGFQRVKDVRYHHHDIIITTSSSETTLFPCAPSEWARLVDT
jgi:hypothetical protein